MSPTPCTLFGRAGSPRLAVQVGGSAREHHVPVPSAEVADKIPTRAAELGFAHRDIAAIFEVLAPDTNAAST